MGPTRQQIPPTPRDELTARVLRRLSLAVDVAALDSRNSHPSTPTKPGLRGRARTHQSRRAKCSSSEILRREKLEVAARRKLRRRCGFASVARFKPHRGSWRLDESRSHWEKAQSVGIHLGSYELLVGGIAPPRAALLRGGDSSRPHLR